MDAVLLIIHLVISVALIALVLLQQGKGADMGAAFGAGASQTVFGASGAGNFLSRTTAVLAAAFFISSLALAYLAMQGNESESVVDRIGAPVEMATDANSDLPMIPEENPVNELPPE